MPGGDGAGSAFAVVGVTVERIHGDGQDVQPGLGQGAQPRQRRFRIARPEAIADNPGLESGALGLPDAVEERVGMQEGFAPFEVDDLDGP